MTAASYWSLVSPAFKMAKNSRYYGVDGKCAFGPVAIGFALGGLFVMLFNKCIPANVSKSFLFVTIFFCCFVLL